MFTVYTGMQLLFVEFLYLKKQFCSGTIIAGIKQELCPVEHFICNARDVVDGGLVLVLVWYALVQFCTLLAWMLLVEVDGEYKFV